MDVKRAEIETRFQLLITMSLFLPILMSSLGTLVGQSVTTTSQVLVQTSVVVGLYLFDYIIFQVIKNDLTEKSLKYISVCLLVSLGIFIVPILGITLGTSNVPLWVAKAASWTTGAALIFILSAPPVIELVLLFSGKKRN